MALFGAFSRHRHLDELDDPLVTAAGVLTPAQRAAACLGNLARTALTAAQLAVLATNTSSGAELSLLDGSVAGTNVLGKAVIADATTGAFPLKRFVVADGAAVVLTTDQSGALCVCDKTDGFLFTLPEATAATVGVYYDFVWPASWASGDQKIITGNAADFILGTVLKFDSDTLTDPLAVESFNGSTHIAVLINAATDGGILGSWLRLTCISATQWVIEGVLHHTGNVTAAASTS